ncbi:MAG: GHKL domain-containing protein [Ruminococcus flavefaciens]|nr:GHKL domain-containing protein [Ruminococcus flavefaciens]MCM1061932.1 GHKL domain-containing protein [Eubacterium sp.]
MKNILWETFEIAVNFYQAFMIIYFAFSYLGDKKKRKLLKSSGLAYIIALAAAISLMNYLTAFEHFYALAYIAVVFVYSVNNLNGSLLKKIFASSFPVLIMLLSGALTANFSAILFDISLEQILSYNGIERCLSIIATQILIFCFTTLSLKIIKSGSNKNVDLAIIEWILISLVFVISIIICAFLNFISLEMASSRGKIYIVFVFMGIILVNAVVYYLIVDLGKKNIAVRENEILKLKQEYSRQYIKNAAVEYDVLQKLRHDFKDNYSVIYSLFSENKTDKGLKFINNCIDTLAETEVFINTDNDIVNAVINTKLSAAKSLGIECTCLSVKKIDGIEDSDLCRLLSNMLENAVAACMKSRAEHRCINLRISFDEYNYIFNLKNTIDTSVLDKNPALKTTKSDSKLHGFGTKIIQDIAEKYNGQCDFYEERNYFCCNVTLSRK